MRSSAIAFACLLGVGNLSNEVHNVTIRSFKLHDGEAIEARQGGLRERAAL